LYVPIILAVPTTYGVCAASALRIVTATPDESWNAEALMDAAEMYSAISLFAFLKLLMLYVKVTVFDDQHAPIPLRRMTTSLSTHRLAQGQLRNIDRSVRESLKMLVNTGVMQFVILQIIVTILEVLAKLWAWFHPGSCEHALKIVVHTWLPEYDIKLHMDDSAIGPQLHNPRSSLACESLWEGVCLAMYVADFFMCGIALIAIVAYENAFGSVLHPVRPLLKFWGVKGMLSVGFMQKICCVY